jgi:hypothetical protein
LWFDLNTEQGLIHFLLSTRFYFPNGNPTGKTSQDALVKKFTDAFAKYKCNTVKLEELGQVLKVKELFCCHV